MFLDVASFDVFPEVEANIVISNEVVVAPSDVIELQESLWNLRVCQRDAALYLRIP